MPTIAKNLKKNTAGKKAAKNGSPKTSAKASKTNTNGFRSGTYIVPRGHVSIAVPTFWTLRQTNDDLQVESEASETTVVVTAYQRSEQVKSLDARDYLKHFLETAPVAGRVQRGESSKQKASARYRDEEGDNWFVLFISNGKTLLLATCHSNRPLTSREGKTGVAVLDSITLKTRA
ncbi:MAG: hypothetical protein CXZ00_11205 [Acidobacteria bacterium]|nr:MAG: hypothetical protein CXZ00_11205 [Acidobacteriota bacterium]